MNNFPLYIPSKSRCDTMLTSRALNEMKVEHYIVIEEQEYDDYKKSLYFFNINTATLVVLDKKYQDDYDTFDNLGDTKSKGPGAARNFAWDHSIQQGYTWHWVMDDNIRAFYYYTDNRYYKVKNKVFWKIMEDFVLRYENVAMAGPQYTLFIAARGKYKPFCLNTRIYSCNFIRNDTPYRWRGRYNEDTDLSLRMLKDKWCTIEFNAFLQDKASTQTVKGGNDEVFYSKEGTYPKSEMLVRMHPDVTKLVYKFSRVHHEVNYRPFKSNKLIKKNNLNITDKINNYGLKLVRSDNYVNHG